MERYSNSITRLNKPRLLRYESPKPRLEPDPHDLEELALAHQYELGQFVPRLDSHLLLDRYLCIIKPRIIGPEPEIGQPVALLDRQQGLVDIRTTDRQLVTIPDSMYWVLLKQRMTNEEWQVIAKFAGMRWVDFKLVREGLPSGRATR